MSQGPIIIPYTPRECFKNYHAITKRNTLTVAHRRAGKTVARLNKIIRAAVGGPSDGRYGYLGPTYVQAKDIAWGYLKHYTAPLLEHGGTKNEAELSITLPGGQIIRLYGAENYDRMRGLYFNGVALDEAQDIPPAALTQVILPALADRGGWLDAAGTPKGRGGLLYQLRQMALADPDGWFYQELKASDTGILPQFELDRLKLLMPSNEYEQEMECFPAGTLVATSRGHVPIELVRAGDTVLTHRCRWRPVMRAMSKSHDGDMVAVRTVGSYTPIVSTPEHPYRVYDKSNASYKWVNAENLVTSDCLFLPSPKTANKVISEALARVVAWYVCEGSVNQNCVQFSLNPYNRAEVALVILLLADCGYEAKEQSPGCVRVFSVEFADRLVSWCGSLAENKRLPFDVIGGHEEAVFIDLMAGDGCLSQPVSGGHCWIYATISRGLAYDVQLLSGMLGRRATVIMRPAGEMVSPANGKTYQTAESYQVRIPYGKKMNHASEREAFPVRLGTVYRVRDVERLPFKGTVYNLSVKEDESYVVEGRAVHNCSFDAALTGAYYSKELAAAADRITAVPWEPVLPVHTAWDIGMADSTSIVFWQQTRGGEIRIIDYYEAAGHGLDHYVRALRDRNYTYGKHYAPHDIKVRELGTGKSRMEVASSLGIRFDLAPNISIEDGINAVRMMLPKCYFDKVKAGPLLEALRMYREKRDVNRNISLGPLHDWSSHAADCFRYMALCQKHDTGKWGSSINYPGLGVI